MKRGNNLAKLKAQRLKRYKKLHSQMEKINSRLDRIAEFQRRPDDILKDIRKRHDRQFHAEELLRQPSVPTPHSSNFPSVLIIAFVFILAIGVFAFYPQLSITGHAVADSTDSDWWNLDDTWQDLKDNFKSISFTTTTSFVMIAMALTILIASFVSKVEKNHKTRHDKFKHPLMRGK